MYFTCRCSGHDWAVSARLSSCAGPRSTAWLITRPRSAPAGSRSITTGLWKDPNDRSHEYNTIEYWQDVAKILERGKFNGILYLRSILFSCNALWLTGPCVCFVHCSRRSIADALGAYDVRRLAVLLKCVLLCASC